MNVVIDIPEKWYRWAKFNDIANGSMVSKAILDAVRNGTPLPKGHGKIGDLDALREEVSSWGMNDYEPSDFTDEIDKADTIIEADKAESEKE